MQNANILCMTPGVIACQASQEIQTTNVFHVSVNRVSSITIKTFLNAVSLNLFLLLFIAPLPTSPTVAVGCTSDNDCPLYTACRDTKCINPCADENPCGRYAMCRVINHRPECTCPDGFIGDPSTSCELRESMLLFIFWHFAMSTCACIELVQNQV